MLYPLAIVRSVLLILVALFLSSSMEAKRVVRKTKPVAAKSKFDTDWKNTDSLVFYYNQKISTGDYVTALRIADSILKHPSLQSHVNIYSLKKISLLDSLGRKNDALFALNAWKETLISSDSLSLYSELLQERFESAGDFKTAMELGHLIQSSQSEHALFLQQSIDSLEQKNQEMKTLSGSIAKASILAEQKNKIIFWTLISLAVILATVCAWLIVRQVRMRNQHEKLGAQMDHTRTQIDKAFEEGDRINAEIRSMKEQMARIEAEKKQMRQNISDSTSETLPLLRQQLDALAKENSGALPVEKYMAIQNTITRLNKQLRDMS